MAVSSFYINIFFTITEDNVKCLNKILNIGPKYNVAKAHNLELI